MYLDALRALCSQGNRHGDELLVLTRNCPVGHAAPVKSLSARSLAHHLLAALMGVLVLARVRPEKSLLEGAVGAALAVLARGGESPIAPLRVWQSAFRKAVMKHDSASHHRRFR
jgi:hypothetical protein